MMYNTIQTIRYMGNKSKLLDFIIPEIEMITREGDLICDLMAGTNSIGYALKHRNRLICNDIQEYSQCISKAIIENKCTTINSKIAEKKLKEKFDYNMKNGDYNFFHNVYTDTYFSDEQCLQIDSIRYAIEYVKDSKVKNLFICALMGAMCKVQSSPGHFAQYMPKDHKRTQSLRKMNVWNEFIDKCNEFDGIVKTEYNNMTYNLDYKELLKKNVMKDVKCFYLDSPYSGEQYSRFYHVLETIVKYDSPEVSSKAKYRSNRFMSEFCYKKSVEKEFENIIKFTFKNKSHLVISYSNKGLIECQKIEEIAKKYYSKVIVKTNAYSHSTQGKGTNHILEYLFILQY